MRKFAFGVLWCLAIYVICTFVGGFFVGAMAAWNDPGNAAIVAEAAGKAFGQEYRWKIFWFSFFAAFVGSNLGLLPGIRTRRSD